MPLDIENHTEYACEFAPMTARNGAQIFRIIARASFDIGPGGALTPSVEPPPIRFEDEYWGEEGSSSLKYECDIALERAHTDLLVVGSAHAPNEKPAKSVDVGLMYQGKVVKHMRVFGDRRWDYGLRGWVPTPTEPFLTKPVNYDNAFGGMDDKGSIAENRVGTGYTSKLTPEFAGTRVPNVEYIDELISSPSDRPRPAGLGVLSRDWVQRSQYAGTYDAKWLEERMPLLPLDFDMRFNQSAPPEQWIPAPKGGETISVAGMSPSGGINLKIPPTALNLGLYYKSREVERAMPLEGVVVDCERMCLELTWRMSADVHGDPFELLYIVIDKNTLKKPAQICC